jgi:hypothetical protein
MEGEGGRLERARSGALSRPAANRHGRDRHGRRHAGQLHACA